ncbi:MAG: hypothetical protein ACPGU1_02115 [Myxococcota bacterium]
MLAVLVLGGCSSTALEPDVETADASDVASDNAQPAPDVSADTAAEPRDSAEVIAPPIDVMVDDAAHGRGNDDGAPTSSEDTLVSSEDIGPSDTTLEDGLDDTEAPSCQSYSSPQVTGTLPPTVTEASGMAISRTQPGVLWLHNDSGDKARIYALEASGERLATVTLEETYAYDWEDMAQGPCEAGAPESSCLYVGDIGDNNKARTYLKIHRVPEPDVSLGDHTVAREDYDTMTVVYPDGPRDCEALIVDSNGYVYLLSKEWSDTVFRLYGSPFLPGAELVPMQFLSEHDISDVGGTVALVTAASFSISKNRLLVRTYGAAFEYQLGPDETLSELPWATTKNVPVANEGQGEAVAYDEVGYWHVSEGKEPPIWQIQCE